jgi:hypothetical protein
MRRFWAALEEFVLRLIDFMNEHPNVSESAKLRIYQDFFELLDERISDL